MFVLFYMENGEPKFWNEKFVNREEAEEFEKNNNFTKYTIIPAKKIDFSKGCFDIGESF